MCHSVKSVLHNVALTLSQVPYDVPYEHQIVLMAE
jgi:hypothetical protein